MLPFAIYMEGDVGKPTMLRSDERVAVRIIILMPCTYCAAKSDNVSDSWIDILQFGCTFQSTIKPENVRFVASSFELRKEKDYENAQEIHNLA